MAEIYDGKDARHSRTGVVHIEDPDAAEPITHTHVDSTQNPPPAPEILSHLGEFFMRLGQIEKDLRAALTCRPAQINYEEVQISVLQELQRILGKKIDIAVLARPASQMEMAQMLFHPAINRQAERTAPRILGIFSLLKVLVGLEAEQEIANRKSTVRQNLKQNPKKSMVDSTMQIEVIKSASQINSGTFLSPDDLIKLMIDSRRRAAEYSRLLAEALTHYRPGTFPLLQKT